MSTQKRTTNYVFTLNNYTNDQIQQLSLIQCRYLIYGEEIAPTTNTPHLQGFIIYSTLKSFKQVKKDLSLIGNPHIEIAKGSIEQNVTYCSKDNKFTERGIKPMSSTEKGQLGKTTKRLDIDSLIEDIKKGTPKEELIITHANFISKYLKAYQFYLKELSPKYKYDIFTDDKIEKLYAWQEQLLEEIIEYPQGDRKITWIYNKEGNTGKSTIVKHLSSNGWLQLNNGKSSDIAYQWNGENIIFDFSRSAEEHINYDIIESLKNGYVMSPKYESCSKRYNPPQIIIFANWEPNIKALSLDRWDIRRIIDKNNKCFSIITVGLLIQENIRK